MKRMIKVLTTAGLAGALLLSTNGGASAEIHYQDVKQTDNFYHAVENLLEYDAISKTLPNFNPYDNVTRGQASSMIAKVLGLDVTDVKNPSFTDVPTTHQFYPYIAALQNEGILGGKGDGTFGVNDPLTRGQMSAILTKVFNIPLVGVQNVLDYDHQRFSKSTDIIENNSKVITYGPGDYTVIYDYQYKGQWGQQIGTMYYFGFMNGTRDGNFEPNQPIKRSQLANMIYQIENKDIEKRFVFVELEEIKELDKYINYDMFEDESIIDYYSLLTDDKSYYAEFDPNLESDNPFYNARYVIYAPQKEGETYFYGASGLKVAKVIVSKDSEGNWKVNIEKNVEEETTIGDSATVTE